MTSWPSSAYADDPIGFAVEQLGRCPTAQQAEILLGMRDHSRLAAKAGRRTGKSGVISMAALWRYCTRPSATIFLGAPCMRQIDEIVYYEITGLLSDQRCLSCRLIHPERVGQPCAHVTPIDADCAASSLKGIRSPDGRRRIFGSAPRDEQAARGIVCTDAYVDELSGMPTDVFGAIQNNTRASGGTLACFGNPARINDAFWGLFHSTGTWDLHTMSALQVPNVRLCRDESHPVIQGMADHGWVEECREAWGESDIRWSVDILGEFPARTALELITDVEMSEAFARFESSAIEAATGDLWLGIDPATGGGGDDSVIYARRGTMIVDCQCFQGGTAAILDRCATIVRALRRHPEERVDINFDDSSRVGSDLAEALRHLAHTDPAVRFHGLNSRGNIERNSPLYGHGYARPRDAYWGNAALRLKKNVAVAYDGELRQEFLTAEWVPDLENNLKRLVDKRVHRKRLGRSPDRADALAYCLFEGRLEAYSDVVEAARVDVAAAVAARPPLDTSPSAMRSGRNPASPYKSYNPYR